MTTAAAAAAAGQWVGFPFPLEDLGQAQVLPLRATAGGLVQLPGGPAQLQFVHAQAVPGPVPAGTLLEERAADGRGDAHGDEEAHHEVGAQRVGDPALFVLVVRRVQPQHQALNTPRSWGGGG